MKESELEIKELDTIRQSMSAVGTKTYYPAHCSDIYVYIVANAEHDKALQKKILSVLKDNGVKNAINAKNCPIVLRKTLSSMPQSKAVKILSDLHPDKELFVGTSKTMNACGCSSTMSSTGEENEQKPNSNEILQNANKYITTGIVIAGLSIFTLIMLKD